MTLGTRLIPLTLEFVTDVERLARPTTPRPSRGLRHSRWVLPTLVVVAVCSSTVPLLARPAGASLQSARAEANHLYGRIQSESGKVAHLGQVYDAALLKVNTDHNIIVHTQEIVAAASLKVSADQNQLKTAALAYYVNAGAQAAENPLFSGNEANIGATGVYTQIAEGNLSASVSALRNSSITLTQQRHILHSQYREAARAELTASQAYHRAQSIQATLNHDLSEVHGQIASIVNADAAAANTAALHIYNSNPINNSNGNYPVPATDSAAGIAVATALSYVGVPYVWGGASRSGVDCSGLVMLAWDAAGVYLPHYSGAQYEDTIHIPYSDIEPGDLIFYGYDGDEHVTMYVGNGEMVEAPETGYDVHVTPVRFGFWGVGRVR